MPRSTYARSTYARSAVARTTAALAVAAALLVTGAGVASAHDALLSTNPADGASVATVPASVVLHFEEPPVKIGMQVLVHGPGGGSVAVGSPQLSGSDVTQAISAGAGPGSYRVLWRVTSDDGHPVSGAFTFTAEGAAATATSIAGPTTAAGSTPTATAAAAPSSTTSTTSTKTSTASTGGTSRWWFALLLLVLVPVGAMGWRRARRASGSSD